MLSFARSISAVTPGDRNQISGIDQIGVPDPAQTCQLRVTERIAEIVFGNMPQGITMHDPMADELTGHQNIEVLVFSFADMFRYRKLSPVLWRWQSPGSGSPLWYRIRSRYGRHGIVDVQ